ncbi:MULTISPECIES: outer membrane beta-barrel protein [Odoribacteraceae]|uniref:outer membrane beta-barrel protein n=1 Tax=Odoribacteraceae TaxID=1853231 RepID=UPI000E49ACC0|nr:MULTISPECIES: outer membrane beta-barrel protein [Odoribacteraceae]MCQ4873817.1 PorT family protein [Butyricimonas paravirosa]RHR79659.1 hypothetical protein DWW52_08745 [Odoribacter sp. AF15-53]
MRSIIITLTLLLSFSLLAQAGKTCQADTIDAKIKQVHLQEKKSKGDIWKTEVLSDPIHRRVYQRSQNPRFRGHWSGFNLGFADFANVKYKLDEESDYMDLERKNSLVMQFNMFQYSMRLNSLNNIGLVTGVGLEYQRLRFEHKNSILRGENGHIAPLTMDHVKKSSLKNLYLTVPLMFEWQFPAKKYQRAYVAAGIMGGLRLHTKTKIVYKNENGDTRRLKHSGNYNMNPVKADAVVRIGYYKLALWGSYTINNMMKSDKAPEVHPFTIGFGVNF